MVRGAMSMKILDEDFEVCIEVDRELLLDDVDDSRVVMESLAPANQTLILRELSLLLVDELLQRADLKVVNTLH